MIWNHDRSSYGLTCLNCFVCLLFSSFGFGVLDALRMVQAAERWEGVGRQVEHHEKGR